MKRMIADADDAADARAARVAGTGSELGRRADLAGRGFHDATCRAARCLTAGRRVGAEGQVLRPPLDPRTPRPMCAAGAAWSATSTMRWSNRRSRIRFDVGLHIDTPDRAEFFYAKCGCYRDLELEGLPIFDPHAPGPGPGAATDVNFKQIVLQGEYAFTNRFSVQGDIPLRFDPTARVCGGGVGFSDHGGLGDIQMGFKYEVVSQPNSVATVNLRTFLPTGNASHGLGTNHASIQPALLLYQRFSDRLVVESQSRRVASESVDRSDFRTPRPTSLPAMYSSTASARHTRCIDEVVSRRTGSRARRVARAGRDLRRAASVTMRPARIS